MKNTTHLPSLFRSLLAAGFAAGLLLAPAQAAEAATTAPAAATGAQAQDAAAEHTALLDELAKRAEERALFAAQTAPRLSSAFRDSRYRHRTDMAENLADALWELRSNPAVQKEWLEKLAGPDLDVRKRESMLREFESFWEETHYLAETLGRQDSRKGNLWTKFRGRYLPDPPNSDGGKQPGRPTHIYARTAETLKQAKAREALFADALVLNNALRQAKAGRHDIREYLGPLLKLKDMPDELQLAATLVGNEDIPRDRVLGLMQKLATDPAAARREIADAGKIAALEGRYLFATRMEGARDFVLLPLAGILPDAVRAVEKPGTIPLAAYEKTETEKTLSRKRMKELLPEDFRLRSEDGKSMVPLPFLEKGERLYMLLPEGPGARIFAGTPLDALAYVGPRVAEYAPDTAETLFAPFFMGNRGKDTYLIAAACGPEELAAHLGSLSVVSSAREKSLYGPFADFVWKEEDQRRWRIHSKHLKEKLPKDIPGETFRLAAVGDANALIALAPLADKKGLERLMGPIRGVWTKDNGRYDAEPWAEMRYAPSAKAEPFALGKSPVLGLNTTALKALIAGQEKYLVRAWADYALRGREEAADDDRRKEQYRAAIVETEAKFAAMHARGFVSPMDAGTALYLLEEFRKDAVKLEAMRAVLDDTAKSSARRVAAMQAIAYN
ncbi:exported hypothetical protein [uncultured delta proteobacterium]|uniref:Uncharacterized protein n=1 Tax=uncultured delta proteobacterium TaxID=34034 RepID=A0A212JLI5_9DELT|nr:exported hypothetical protein [uncultured delta proteobacterium]